MANINPSDYIEFVKKNINKYMKIICEKNYNREAFLELLDTYINVRYYNYYDIKYKNFEANINYYMKDKASEMIKDKDDKYINSVKTMFYMFKYMLYFDNVTKYDSIKNIVLEIDEYRNSVLGLNDDNFVNSFIEIINNNEKKKNNYLNGFDNNKFFINYFKTNKNNLVDSDLSYDIKFNKIYSEYAINKVYNTGIVNEQKLFIMYYLVSNQILKNAINGEFNKEYMVSFPLSIISKQDKLNRLVNIISNDVIKNNIVIKFSYSDYTEYKDMITDWIKDGYKIAIILDDKFKYDDNSNIWLTMFSYVICSDENNNIEKDKRVIIKK